jgi:hypothetical protein
MRTNAEFVSRVTNDLKSLSKDGRVNRRHILSIGQDKAKFYINQKLDEMTLFREDGIISTIECFELENIPAKKCGIFEFQLCKSLMKSVKKLPDTLFGKNGAGILEVSTLDGSQVFRPTNTRRYRDITKLKYKRDTSLYYVIQDNYLYLPDAEIEAVNVQLIVLKKWEIEKLSSCCSTKDDCKSYWDYEFVCPGRFYDLVVRDTLTEMVSIYRTSVEDTNPNLDPNQPGKTTM